VNKSSDQHDWLAGENTNQRLGKERQTAAHLQAQIDYTLAFMANLELDK